MTSSYHANFFNLSIIQEPLVILKTWVSCYKIYCWTYCFSYSFYAYYSIAQKLLRNSTKVQNWKRKKSKKEKDKERTKKNSRKCIQIFYSIFPSLMRKQIAPYQIKSNQYNMLVFLKCSYREAIIFKKMNEFDNYLKFGDISLVWSVLSD